MRPRFGSSWLCALSALGVFGCFSPDEGRPPNPGNIYFPVGIALGRDVSGKGPGVMYVANSDFDLQYNAGTVQAFDLDKIEKVVGGLPEIGTDAACAEALGPGVRAQTAAEQLLYPAPCTAIDPAPYLHGSVVIGAFATDVLYRDNPKNGGGRLFVPVRGDTTLHWIDVDDTGTLSCGQDDSNACDHNHRRGGDPAEENTRGVQLPAEPFGIAADDRGDVVVTTHQSDGKVSLFTNSWDAGSGGGPYLQFVAGGGPNDPPGALAIASIPKPAFLDSQKCTAYEPSFLLSFRTAAQVRLVRYFSDQPIAPECGEQRNGADPARPFLDMTAAAFINTNSTGFNSRGIAVDATVRQDCEKGCSGDESCLRDCAHIGLDVFVANRSPATLILGRTPTTDSPVGTSDLPSFYSTVSLLSGPSRVIAGAVMGRDGTLQRRIFIVCFDSRVIYVYDPKADLIETVIHTGRGPHAFAVDPKRGLGYVGHFTDSYIGVVDLNLAHTSTYGTMRLTLGVPTKPRASK